MWAMPVADGEVVQTDDPLFICMEYLGKMFAKKSFHAPDTLKKSMERANSMYEHKIQEKDNKYIESLKDEMLGEMETRDLLQCLVFLVGMAVFIYYDTFKSHNYDPNAVPSNNKYNFLDSNRCICHTLWHLYYIDSR